MRHISCVLLVCLIPVSARPTAVSHAKQGAAAHIDRAFPSEAAKPASGESEDESGEISRLELNSGKMSIDFDQSKWKEGKVENGRFSLRHASGGAYAFIIAEPTAVELDALPEIVISHARAEDPEAKIVLREKRLVNGVEVWCLKLEFKAKTIPFAYYGYYFGGKAGTVQIVTCARQNLAGDYENDFQEFLDGFRLTGTN
jgi:hypothetical protein